jgi:hypothetical protein
VQVEYALVDKDKEPEETDWEQGMPTLIPGKKIMMRQKLSTAQDWSTPIQISGEDGIGRDGAGTDFIYILKEEVWEDASEFEEKPELSDPPERGKWSDHPLGVDETYKYEYVSVSTKPEGVNTTWGNFSKPAILSKWGENGRDADTLVYIYSTKKDVTKPTVTVNEDGTITLSSDWVQDMPSLSVDIPLVYCSMLHVPPNHVGELQGSDPVVWARWGQDGKGVEIKGLAYVSSGTEIVEGRDYVLYKDEDGKVKIEEALEGDSYLVNGYLFVYNGGNPVTFSCIGKIQGENGIGIDYVVNYYAVTETEDTPPLFNEVGAPHWVLVGNEGASEKMPVVTA